MSKKTKLLKKTSKSFLLTGLILALLSSIALYLYTKHLLENEIEEELYSTVARVSKALQTDGIIYSLPPVTEIKKVESLHKEILKDTLIYDPSQDEMEVFKELSIYKTINHQNYKITVRDLVVESEDILIAIVLSNIAIFTLAFLFLFYFNTSRNLQLWSPFFENLEQMKQFSLTSKVPIKLVDSNILEFSELKTEIETLTNKVKSDYENLKQFTEDVSHEMQTPLPIIQAKIDNLINEHTIKDKQFEQITSLQKDIQRLKQLNKRVTILTKIDKNQFVNIELVNFTNIIEEKIENFKELDIQNIVHFSNKKLIVSMDMLLADMLINNLLSNAIKHSAKADKISIITNETSLIISNIGNHALLHPEKLFQRFYRENKQDKSTGLGLAIVKKICDLYDFEISYEFKLQQHIFSVKF